MARLVASMCVRGACALLVGSLLPAVLLAGRATLPPGAVSRCGSYDDGTSENLVGYVGGGETGYLQYFSCPARLDSLLVAYGEVQAGSPVTLCVWDDPSDDGNPADAILIYSEDTTVINPWQLFVPDVLNEYPLDPPLDVDGGFWVGAVVTHAAGEFPGPLDEDSPTPNSWVIGDSSDINVNDLSDNDFPPAAMESLGLPGAWLLRVTGPDVGSAYCFGDGTGTPCPCGNAGAVAHGCGNGTFAGGCALSATGRPSVSSDSLRLHVALSTPGQPGLLFQGDNAINGGDGAQFGDGLRCAGGNVVRLEIVTADPTGSAYSTVPIAITGAVSSGDTKYYQWWYRDPNRSPCGSGFNLSNGLEVTWAP